MVAKLKKENQALKHELESTSLQLAEVTDEGKSQKEKFEADLKGKARECKDLNTQY